jgi:hypothetical protein
MTQEMVIDEVKKLKSPELLNTLYQYTRFLVETGADPDMNAALYEDFKSEDEMNEFIAAFAGEYFND